MRSKTLCLILLWQVELAHVHIDDLDPERRARGGSHCRRNAGNHRGEAPLAVAGRHEGGERVASERRADLAEDQVGKALLGVGAAAQGPEEALGISDAPRGQAAHHHVLLVRGQILRARRPRIEQPPFQAEHAVER